MTRAVRLPAPTIGRFLLASRRSAEAKHPGPWCRATVDSRRVAVANREERRQQAQMKGLRYDQCGRPATHSVDGLLFCEPHAGAHALAILLEEE